MYKRLSLIAALLLTLSVSSIAEEGVEAMDEIVIEEISEDGTVINKDKPTTEVKEVVKKEKVISTEEIDMTGMLPGINDFSDKEVQDLCLLNGGSWTLPDGSSALKDAYCQFPGIHTNTNKVLLKIKGKTFPISGRFVNYGKGSLDWIVVLSTNKVFKLDGASKKGVMLWSEVKGDLNISVSDKNISF